MRDNKRVSIPASFIQDLLTRVDIVDVVGRYVPLKKSGANYMGLCPFHGEKSPSFSVSPTKQFFHCFGCGKGGDAIAFLKEHTGMEFVEAVQDLAGEVGMVVPQEDINPREREQRAAQKSKQANLNDVLERAGESYRKQLKSQPHAVQYLQQRGVSGTIASRYGLGYAPGGWKHLANVFPSYDDPLLVESGLVIVGDGEDKRYDRFRDRIMFPIRDVKGLCIGFGGRVLGDEKPKYLNSPETPLFHKGRELYGLFEARNALREMGYALVTEGYMDVVALAQLNFPNAVATLGTACTPEHVQKLFRFTDSIVFSFDGDAAGRRAARKALEAVLPLTTDPRIVKFLFLPAEHAPDSFIRAQGADAFARMVHNATPLSEFLLEAASEECDLGTAQGRARMSSQARPLWNLLPEGAFKRLVLSELSHKIQLDARELGEVWAQTEAQERRYQRPTSQQHSSNSFAPSSFDSGPPPHWDTPASWSPEAQPPYGAAPYEPTGGYAPSGYSGGYQPSYGQNAPNNYRNNGTGGNYRNGNNWGQRRDGKSRTGWNNRNGGEPAQPLAPRIAPTNGPDQAARLLLSHMAFLESLDNDDMDALVHLPPPHGSLFAWIESQYQEHGPQPWAVLQSRLADSTQEKMVQHLMQGPHAHPEGEEDEQRQELRGILNLLLAQRIKALEDAAIAEMATDPSAIQRYRALQERRKRLQAPPTTGST